MNAEMIDVTYWGSPLNEDERRGLARRQAVTESWQWKVEWLASLVRWDAMFMISNRVKVPRCETMERAFVSWMKHDWPGVPTFYAIGLHPGGHGAHCHGTMKLNGRGILWTTIWKSAFDRFGRSSFEPPRVTGSVLGYISKPAIGEALKHGHWGLIGVSQDPRTVARVLRRPVIVHEPSSTVDEITVADVEQGNKGLPSPELNLVDEVNLWK